MTPSASATTWNSPVVRSSAKPFQAGTGAGRILLSKATHSTSSNSDAGSGGPSAPMVSPMM